MDTAKVCAGCHKPLVSDAPDGLCPECLMKAGLGTDADLGQQSEGASRPKPFAAPPPEEISPHFPQLEILELLGQGGMGVVYKARQPHLNRLVALKVLAAPHEQDPSFAERFTREAQTLARLSHPNIVILHDFGKVDGLYYLLMEYVDGVSLRQLMQAKKLTAEQALAIVPKICEALQYAHEQGVVHRDIKPENVLLTKEGRVKIADFGIAKMVGGEKQPAITRDQQVIGTPHYMAPEQVEHPQQVDHRADIYSLGVVFYEMLTGELPLGKFPPPSSRAHGVQIDVRLDEIVLHALEKQPERRYQHARDVKTDLESVTSPSAPEANAQETGANLRVGLGLAGVLVGTRNGVKTIRWPVVFQEWLLICGLGGLAFFLIGKLANLGFGIVESWVIAFFPATVWVVFWVLRCWSAPKETLKRVEGLEAGTFSDWLLPAVLLVLLALAISLHKWFRKPAGAEPAAVVAVEEKLRREILQRLNEAGWQPEGLSVSVTPDLKRAECRFGKVWKNGLTMEPFNAGIRLKAQGRGLWQVLGEGEFHSLHFSVNTAAEMSAPQQHLDVLLPQESSPVQTNSLPAFGPVHEVLLNDMDESRGGEVIDFDSARSLDISAVVDLGSRTQQARWLHENSADLLLDFVRGQWGLLTPTDNELKLAPLPTEKWDLTAEGDLPQAFSSKLSGLEIKQHGPWTVYILATNAQPPLTFAFRTGSGTTGLLQLLRFGENPNCASLRYKLLKKPSAEALQKNN